MFGKQSSSPRREQPVDRLSRAGEVAASDVDGEANKIANKVAREHREQIRRRKWAIETACLCPEEMTTIERIGLARAIDAYVHEGEAA